MFIRRKVPTQEKEGTIERTHYSSATLLYTVTSSHLTYQLS